MAPPAGAFRHLSLALGAAVAALGSLLFIAWKIYFRDVNDSCIGWRGRWEQQLRAELERKAPKESQPHSCQYQVLVLGLDGAGKSSIIHYVCSTEAKKHIAPTQGFSSVQLQADGLQLDLLEVGGSQNLRFYWNQYLSKSHVLVFVVDSADGLRLPTARQELHCLLAEDPQLPLIVLANKQGWSLHRKLETQILAWTQTRTGLQCHLKVIAHTDSNQCTVHSGTFLIKAIPTI
ncbi:ADP-ribosylation factor-like protein 10 isoform X2 [Pogona vitticeps]